VSLTGSLDNWKTRLRVTRKALSLKPDYTEAHFNLGNAFKELGQLEDAVKSYEKALSLKPDHANAHNNLGNAFFGSRSI
jgi:Tfp pilus assembly protein PilF